MISRSFASVRREHHAEPNRRSSPAARRSPSSADSPSSACGSPAWAIRRAARSRRAGETLAGCARRPGSALVILATSRSSIPPVFAAPRIHGDLFAGVAFAAGEASMGIDDPPLRHLAEPAEQIAVAHVVLREAAQRRSDGLLKQVFPLYLATELRTEIPFDVGEQLGSPEVDVLGQRGGLPPADSASRASSRSSRSSESFMPDNVADPTRGANQRRSASLSATCVAAIIDLRRRRR